MTEKKPQASWSKRNSNGLRIADKSRRNSLKQEVLVHYGQICCRCGFSDTRALQIDHVNDDGAAERLAKGRPTWAGTDFYRSLKTRGWPEGYQTLCANCNMIKRQEFLDKAFHKRTLVLFLDKLLAPDSELAATRTCEGCGIQFSTLERNRSVRIDKRYCSSACKLRAFRARRRTG